MKIGFSQWRKEAPKEIQGIAVLLLAEAAAIGSYGLAANVPWAGYAGLGCLILGTFIEKLSGVSEKTQPILPQVKPTPTPLIVEPEISQPSYPKPEPPDTPGPGGN